MQQAGVIMEPMPRDRLLDEQLAYYRARAGEYDEWWLREGRYDRGSAWNGRWHVETARLREVFDGVGVSGSVVELAAGTGLWTQLIVQRGASVTALDGSAEALDVNRERLGPATANVDYQVVDLFEWEPQRRWDAMVHCFWLSHVPRDRLAEFWDRCRRAQRNGASVFFADSLLAEASTAADHVAPASSTSVVTRRLNDGREFRVIKNFYEPAELIDAGRVAGFDLEVGTTGEFFWYATGTAV